MSTGLPGGSEYAVRTIKIDRPFVTNSVKIVIEYGQSVYPQNGSFYFKWDVQLQAPPLIINKGIDLESNESKIKKAIKNFPPEVLDAFKD